MIAGQILEQLYVSDPFGKGQGADFRPLCAIKALFHVDCFAVWIERTVDTNLLALILFCQILAVDVV